MYLCYLKLSISIQFLLRITYELFPIPSTLTLVYFCLVHSYMQDF